MPARKTFAFLGIGFLTGAVLTAGVMTAVEPERQRAPESSANSEATPKVARLRAAVLDPPDPRTFTGSPRAAAPTGAPPDSDEQCEDPATEGALCPHGSEPPPAGVDTEALPTVAQLRARRFGGTPPGLDRQSSPGASDAGPGTATSEETVVTPEAVESTGTVPCVGDGVSGPRVQAIYAHAADVPGRYTDVLPLVRRYAADVSNRLNLAAGRSGQGRAVRFVTTGSPCVLDVRNVTLPTKADDTFASSVTALRELGFNRTDRKYLVWMDAAVGICGVGHVYTDDKPTSDNLNTRGNMFARADAPCWGYAELHELLHTLGAVQNSAPSSTGASHCTDQNDTMCYSDTSGAAMRQLCKDAPQWNVDCELNDYFNAAAPRGSYLDTHWNAADSPYLAVTNAPPAAPLVKIGGPTQAYAGTAIDVTAKVTVAPGATIRSLTWTSSRTDCRFDRPQATATRYWCPVTAAGGARLTAWVTDSNGTQTSATHDLKLPVPSPRRAVSLSLARSATSIEAGRTATLRGTLTDKATGKVVIGMPVALYRRARGSTGWQKISTRNTNSHGGLTYTVRPTRTTDYQLASGYTTTWATGKSPTRRINVTR